MNGHKYICFTLISNFHTETIFCSDKYLGRVAGDASRKAFSLHVDRLLLLNCFKTQKDMKFFVKILQHHISWIRVQQFSHS